MRDFERNGLNLSASKREELMRLKAQIDELSAIYIQNLNDASAFLPFNEAELAGLPLEFLKVWYILLPSIHLTSAVMFLKKLLSRFALKPKSTVNYLLVNYQLQTYGLL